LADHLAIAVEGRSARIALVDRRVDLQEVVIGAGLDIAAARGQHADRDGAAETERISDRDYPVTDLQFVGIAKFDEGQLVLRVELQQRDVCLLIGTDQLRAVLALIGQLDHDVASFGYDVIAGHDIARGIDDETGAEAHTLRRRAIGPLLLAELAEHLLEGRAFREVELLIGRRLAAFATMHAGHHDDRGAHLLGQRGEALGHGGGDGRRPGEHQAERGACCRTFAENRPPRCGADDIETGHVKLL
jgi:hypothetical protein